MAKKFQSGAIPLDYSEYGAPRQPRRKDWLTVVNRADHARLGRHYPATRQTAAERKFEERKFPGIYD